MGQEMGNSERRQLKPEEFYCKFTGMICHSRTWWVCKQCTRDPMYYPNPWHRPREPVKPVEEKQGGAKDEVPNVQGNDGQRASERPTENENGKSAPVS